jgi:Pyruvate/2-oxoacid:ferredoxin oxidoreductase gamma subunit
VTEREVLMTGIGGQGIQLAAQVLCRAALAEGRDVQLFGSYGGMMRGGNTEATIILADGPVEAPPTVSRAWSGLALHHEHFAPVARLLRPGAVVLVNTTVFEGNLDRDLFSVVEVPATELAGRAGNVMAASMVMLGAFSAATAMVSLESLSHAVAEALPPYRSQHVSLNVAALGLGHEAVPEVVAEAWPVAEKSGR